MSETHEGAAALQWLHTGAEREGGAQVEALESLGGFVSDSPITSYTINRRAPIRGIRVLDAGGVTSGAGVLTANESDSLKYTPPQQNAGAAVTIANGESKQAVGA
jgi:hypothetical protein